MEYNETFEYSLLIQESHLDTFGHVNNASYVKIFEEARWDFITKHGYGLEKIKETQLGPVILAMDLKFKREVLNRERVTVKSRTTDYRERIGWLEQTLYNEKGEIACMAKFTFGLLDMRKRSLVEPTPEWRHAVGLEP